MPLTLYPVTVATVFAVGGLASQAVAQVGPNIDDLAKELANPGAANATMSFKLEFRGFDGDLPGADKQDSTTLTFQPVLPFILPNGNNLIFRPAFSYGWGAPRRDPSSGSFTGLDDWNDTPTTCSIHGEQGTGRWVPGSSGAFPSGPRPRRTTGCWARVSWLSRPSTGVWRAFFPSTTRRSVATARTRRSRRFSISSSMVSATAGRSARGLP